MTANICNIFPDDSFPTLASYLVDLEKEHENQFLRQSKPLQTLFVTAKTGRLEYKVYTNSEPTLIWRLLCFNFRNCMIV